MSEFRKRLGSRPRLHHNRPLARPGIVLLVVGLLLAGLTMAFGPRGVRWLSEVTGEESLWEGTKGAVALAVLEVTGPDPELAPYGPADHLDVNPFGANTFLQLEAEPANVARSLALLDQAGFGWIRQEFPWEDIEIHGPGDFEDRRNVPYRSAWAKYDRMVDEATAHDISVLVRLDNPPDWAFADPAAAGEKGPPDDLEDFGRFSAAVAERYCGRVNHYQIWNEPNIYPEWGERDVDPADYAELLSVAHRYVTEACPEAVIVSAALAPTTEPGGRNMDDLAYLEALYAAGWSDSFDVLAAQGFGLWTGPSDRRASRDRTNFARPELVRDIMVRHGDEAKPVWITEMGWNSPPEDLDVPDRGKYGVTTEAQRAEYTVEAFQRIQRDWPWAGVGFVWMFRRPDWEWHTRPEGYFRLVEPDWRLTPAYDAVAEMANRPPQLHWGRHLNTHPAFVYSGPWQTQDDGVRVGSPGAELAFGFVGSGYSLDVGVSAAAKEGGDVTATVFEVVDGETRTVELDPEADGGTTLERDGLGDGDHMTILRVDEGHLAVEGVRIDGDREHPGWWPGVALGLLATGWMVWLVITGFVVVSTGLRGQSSGPVSDTATDAN